MGSVGELKDAVRDTLERKGLLRQMQAHVRAQVNAVLLGAAEPRAAPTHDSTLLINELVREWLIFHGLAATLSVFLPESGQPLERPFDRQHLVDRLHLVETPQSQQVPLLYSLVAQQQAAGALAASAHSSGGTSKQPGQHELPGGPSPVPAKQQHGSGSEPAGLLAAQ